MSDSLRFFAAPATQHRAGKNSSSESTHHFYAQREGESQQEEFGIHDQLQPSYSGYFSTESRDKAASFFTPGSGSKPEVLRKPATKSKVDSPTPSPQILKIQWPTADQKSAIRRERSDNQASSKPSEFIGNEGTNQTLHGQIQRSPESSESQGDGRSAKSRSGITAFALSHMAEFREAIYDTSRVPGRKLFGVRIPSLTGWGDAKENAAIIGAIQENIEFIFGKSGRSDFYRGHGDAFKPALLDSISDKVVTGVGITFSIIFEDTDFYNDLESDNEKQKLKAITKLIENESLGYQIGFLLGYEDHGDNIALIGAAVGVMSLMAGGSLYTALFRARKLRDNIHKAAKGVAEGLQDMSPAERKIAMELLSEGKDVKAVPRIPGQKTPDFIIDGVPTELKTPIGIGPDTVKNAIEKAAKQGDQILIDARSPGISPADAKHQINRAIGNRPNIKGRVTVLTNEGIVSG